MTVSAVLDAAGRRRTPATMPGLPHAHRNARQSVGAHLADDPVDRFVRQANAAVTASRSERIEQAGAAAAVDAHASVTAAELLQHVAVGGEREDVRAEEVGGVPAPDADDGEQAAGGRGPGRPNDDAEAAAQVTVVVDGDRARAGARRRCASASVAAARGRRVPRRWRGWAVRGAAPAASSVPRDRAPRAGRAEPPRGAARPRRGSWRRVSARSARAACGRSARRARPRWPQACPRRWRWLARCRTWARPAPAAARARAWPHRPSRRGVGDRSDRDAESARSAKCLRPHRLAGGVQWATPSAATGSSSQSKMRCSARD